MFNECKKSVGTDIEWPAMKRFLSLTFSGMCGDLQPLGITTRPHQRSKKVTSQTRGWGTQVGDVVTIDTIRQQCCQLTGGCPIAYIIIGIFITGWEDWKSTISHKLAKKRHKSKFVFDTCCIYVHRECCLGPPAPSQFDRHKARKIQPGRAYKQHELVRKL